MQLPRLKALLRLHGIDELYKLPKLTTVEQPPARLQGHGGPAHAMDHLQWVHVLALVKRLELKDDSDAARAFELLHGSLADALESGLMPKAYFQPKPAKVPLAEPSITQLLPVETETHLLIGDIYDTRYTEQQEDYNYDDGGQPLYAGPVPFDDEAPPWIGMEGHDLMKPVDQWIRQPALVRRVACFALMEQKLDDGTAKKHVEPMLYLSATDQETFMQYQGYIGTGPIDRDNSLADSTLPGLTQGGAERTLPASRFLEAICSDRLNGYAAASRRTVDTLWTHLLVAEKPPQEIGFQEINQY